MSSKQTKVLEARDYESKYVRASARNYGSYFKSNVFQWAPNVFETETGPLQSKS